MAILRVDRWFCWLVLMATPVVMQTAYSATVSPVSCTDFHGEAFGVQTLKPGVCYLVSEEKGAFIDARAFCQGLSGSLGWDVADIEDAVENQLIHDAIAVLKEAGSLVNASYFWIGQNDMKTENVWRYLNESSNKCNRSVYLNWQPGQPDGDRRRNCVVYSFGAGGLMQDQKCDNTISYLCKVKITSDTVSSCPGFIEDTDAPDECKSILPEAFGNPSVPGLCYISDNYLDQRQNFQAAVGFCASLPGGDWSVADIEDAEENLFLEVWIRDNFPKPDGYWIGQNDREQEGDYRYTSSGTCPVYLNWQEGQPNGARLANCLVMHKSIFGTFRDVDCSYQKSTFCKLRTDPGPRKDPSIGCNVSTVPPEVAACSSLREGAFGNVAKPGVCYFMTGQKLTWSSAVDFCKSEGWSLIDIENATENELLATRYRDFTLFGQLFWAGQNDREIEGTWKYSSNDTPSDAGVFLNWDVGQPDGGALVDCIRVDKNGLWKDVNCNNQFYVTCKKRIEPVTADPCTKMLHTFVSRPRRFVVLSSDATCPPEDALVPSYHAQSGTQCARDCHARDNCWGFGFAAAGREDNCALCREVPDANDLSFLAGSLYYTVHN